MVLVIMAAGMGSRFGGLKQIQPMDNQGNFLIDYSIFDAIKTGFDEVVFVIRKKNLELFKETIGKRIENKIKTSYVFQENDEIADKFPKFYGREKPLGTGQIISLIKNKVNNSFAVINADDFYGRESFVILAEFLKDKKNENIFSMVLFDVVSTLSSMGDVKRGVCNINNGFLKSILECKISRSGDKLFGISLETGKKFELNRDTKVSMNMFGFQPKIFDLAERDFDRFLNDSSIDPLNSEFFLPNIVSNGVRMNDCRVKALETKSKWLGLTYPGDLEFAKNEIKNLKSLGEYPEELWK